jgi:hypothetical protein
LQIVLKDNGQTNLNENFQDLANTHVLPIWISNTYLLSRKRFHLDWIWKPFERVRQLLVDHNDLLERLNTILLQRLLRLHALDGNLRHWAETLYPIASHRVSVSQRSRNIGFAHLLPADYLWFLYLRICTLQLKNCSRIPSFGGLWGFGPCQIQILESYWLLLLGDCACFSVLKDIVFEIWGNSRRKKQIKDIDLLNRGTICSILSCCIKCSSPFYLWIFALTQWHYYVQ